MPELRFEAIGTLWSVTAEGIELQALEPVMWRRIAAYGRAYSRFRPDSLVSEMARTAGTYRLPEDAEPLLDLYKELYDATGGKVTPLIGQALADAGYDAKYTLVPGEIDAVPSWEDTLEYDYPELTLRRPALLDFGAAGKGYLVDIVAGMLAEAGATGYCVDAGGDIRYRGGGPLRVGLEHPGDPAQAVGVAELREGSICGSAGNRRSWDRFTHILDPDALASPSRVRAVWVTASTALLADGLATALSFAEPEGLRERFGFEWAIVYDDYSGRVSPGFPGELFGV